MKRLLALAGLLLLAGCAVTHAFLDANAYEDCIDRCEATGGFDCAGACQDRADR